LEMAVDEVQDISVKLQKIVEDEDRERDDGK
jgi:hypothetical protein